MILLEIFYIHFKSLPKKKEIKNTLVKMSVQMATLFKLISTLAAVSILPTMID